MHDLFKISNFTFNLYMLKLFIKLLTTSSSWIKILEDKVGLPVIDVYWVGPGMVIPDFKVPKFVYMGSTQPPTNGLNTDLSIRPSVYMRIHSLVHLSTGVFGLLHPNNNSDPYPGPPRSLLGASMSSGRKPRSL